MLEKQAMPAFCSPMKRLRWAAKVLQGQKPLSMLRVLWASVEVATARAKQRPFREGGAGPRAPVIQTPSRRFQP